MTETGGEITMNQVTFEKTATPEILIEAVNGIAMIIDENKKAEREIEQQVDLYKGAEDALTIIAGFEAELDKEFEEELAMIDLYQKRIAKRLATALVESGIDQTSKEYETVQKEVRKNLFPPMTVVVDAKHPDVTGKTYEKEAFKVTLVEQKPKLVRRQDLSDEAYYLAHKHDVEQLINAGLYNLISIPSDEATTAFVDARAKSGNPLSSVELERSGYCKVVLK